VIEELVVGHQYHGHGNHIGPHEDRAHKQPVIIRVGQVVKGAGGQEALLNIKLIKNRLFIIIIFL